MRVLSTGDGSAASARPAGYGPPPCENPAPRGGAGRGDTAGGRPYRTRLLDGPLRGGASEAMRKPKPPSTAKEASTTKANRPQSRLYEARSFMNNFSLPDDLPGCRTGAVLVHQGVSRFHRWCSRH